MATILTGIAYAAFVRPLSGLAAVVSKYIGETEKILDRVFQRRGRNAVLFLDEADALFGKRPEARDSPHKRYADIEVGYLLQKIEEFHRVAILATNLHQQIDEDSSPAGVQRDLSSSDLSARQQHASTASARACGDRAQSVVSGAAVA